MANGRKNRKGAGRKPKLTPDDVKRCQSECKAKRQKRLADDSARKRKRRREENEYEQCERLADKRARTKKARQAESEAEKRERLADKRAISKKARQAESEEEKRIVRDATDLFISYCTALLSYR